MLTFLGKTEDVVVFFQLILLGDKNRPCVTPVRIILGRTIY